MEDTVRRSEIYFKYISGRNNGKNYVELIFSEVVPKSFLVLNKTMNDDIWKTKNPKGHK